jgi:glycosyltransferase involved in cell wall biosynthesis
MDADAIIFNSHHDLDGVEDAHKANPAALFIHRVDGPMRLYNGPQDDRDERVISANRAFADATVFQSRWSERANRDLGFRPNEPVVVIGNAADPVLFNRHRPRPPLSSPKIRLIATSWSPNPNKGFDVYAWLDRTLDFSHIEMVFIGNTPIAFRNIRCVPPCSSEQLARHLKESDIYLTASRSDPCSNALAEALSCGLPAIARRDGGHPEVLGQAGELFNSGEQIPGLIERVVADYRTYVNQITVPSIGEIAERYIDILVRCRRATQDEARQ